MNDEIVDPAATVETAVKPAEPATATPPTQTGSSENTPAATTTPLPFHEDPKVKDYLERQWSKREQGLKSEIQQLKDTYTKQLERMSNPQKPETPVSPEQEQAIQQLVAALSPRLKKELGLDKLENLEKQFSTMSQSASMEAFESEMGSVTKDYADKYGYDAKQLDQDLREFIETDEWFVDKQYSKGSVKKAAALFFSEKGQELAERAANLKLIKEQNEKKKAGTEQPAKGAGQKASTKEKRVEDFLDRRHQEAGGQISF